MRYISDRLLTTLALTFTAGAALAQSYSSFNAVSGIYGVQVNDSGLNYTVSIDPGAYVIFNNTHLDIANAFGFWSLKSGNVALSASGASQNGYGWDQASNGQGSIAGWHNPNKNFAIQPGQQLTFAYSSIDKPSVEAYGFHLSFVQDWPQTPGSQTAYITGPMNPVPEPATLTALGLGAIALIRRKRAR